MLIWAIICSFLLHVLLVAVIPKFKFDTTKKVPDVLKVVLVQAKKPEPVAVIKPKIEPIIPEKIIPEKIKPAPPKPKEIKPEPIKKALEPAPQKMEQVKPEPEIKQETKPAQTEPQVPTVIAVEPKPAETKREEKPAFVAPPPKPEPVSEDVGAAKSAYLSNIQAAVEHNLKYPKSAELRHITGAARVEVILDNDGNVSSVSIIESSGNSSLDNEAINVIKRSNLKQYMNELLVGKIKSFKTRVQFTLHDQ